MQKLGLLYLGRVSKKMETLLLVTVILCSAHKEMEMVTPSIPMRSLSNVLFLGIGLISYLLSLSLSATTLFHLARASSITNPLPEDGDINKVIPDYFDSKKGRRAYHNTSATDVDVGEIPFVRQYNFDPMCATNKLELKLRWSATVGSSVFAHPMIFPSGPNGKKQIFVATFFNYLEMLGYDGYKPWGWPLSFEGSSFQGSPMLYDIDGDGTNDIGVIDKDGNMYWVRIGEYGQYLEDYHIQVPKLKIARNWYEKLDPKFTDRYVETSMFEHIHRQWQGDPYASEEAKKAESEKKKEKLTAKTDALSVVSSPSKGKGTTSKTKGDGFRNTEFGARGNLFVGQGGRRLQAIDGIDGNERPPPQDGNEAGGGVGSPEQPEPVHEPLIHDTSSGADAANNNNNVEGGRVVEQQQQQQQEEQGTDPLADQLQTEKMIGDDYQPAAAVT
jgi:hypothetical protein